MTFAGDKRHSVAIWDSQPLTTEGLKAVLGRSGSYYLSQPARNLSDLAQIIATESPRLAVVDKAAGTTELIDWIENVQRSETALIIWGTTISDSEALRFMQAGARGVLRKTVQPDNLILCFDAVCSGGTWMDDYLFHGSGRYNAGPRTNLTLREQQVLELVEQGLRNKQIAEELGIRPGTVKIHLKHIFEKSGVRGRYGLALSGIRDRPAMTA